MKQTTNNFKSQYIAESFSILFVILLSFLQSAAATILKVVQSEILTLRAVSH